MPFGQLIHAVAAADAIGTAPGIEAEAFDHGIVDRGDGNAIARQHIEIILDVLPHLEDGIVLKQRFQQRDRGVERDLLWLFGKHVAAAVAKRNITCRIGADGKAHADKVRLHRFKRRCFGINGNEVGLAGFRHPCLQRGFGLHALVSAVIDRGHFRHRLARGPFCGSGCSILQLGRIKLGRAGGAASACIQTLEQAGEAMLGQERGQRLGRDRAKLEGIKRHRQRAIFLERDQHARQPGLIGLFDQALLQLGFLHGGRGSQHRFQIAVFLDQLGGGLGANPEDTGNVIDRIAHQREHVTHLFRSDAKLFRDFGQVDALVLHGIEHVDLAATFSTGADQLHQVLVRGDDRHVPALTRGSARIGGNQIVRLEALFFDAGQRKCARGIADQRKLRAQILGRGRAVGLVFGIDIVAERFAARIQDHRHVRWPFGLVEIVGQLPQHRGIAVNGTHRRPFRVGQRGKAVIGAEDVGRTVDEVEMLLGLHAGVVAVLLRSVSRQKVLAAKMPSARNTAQPGTGTIAACTCCNAST